MANGKWSQLGPGEGGQHRANYLYEHGTLYDVYIGSDVSGVWVAKDIDKDKIAQYENYHYQYISNNKIMRFVNRFYNKSTFSTAQLFVTHRNGIERIDMTNPTAPMTSSFTLNDSWVSDMHIVVPTNVNAKNQIYYVTGSVRLNDEPGNHKNTTTTNDFYYGEIDPTTYTVSTTGVKLTELGLASPEKHVYCLWVNDKNTGPPSDDEFFVGSEYGLYIFNYGQLSGTMPTHVTRPTGIATDAYKVTGITNISPNQFLINVAYQGLFLYNTTTQTWTTQITELMSESEQGSNITYTDMKNNPNAKAFTQLFIARAILPLDVEDEIPPQRKAHMQHQLVQDKHAIGTLVPNPAKYNVLFTYTNESAEQLQIQLTDVLGNVIATYEINGTELSINTTKYVQGVYFLHVMANGIELENHKLVIIK